MTTRPVTTSSDPPHHRRYLSPKKEPTLCEKISKYFFSCSCCKNPSPPPKPAINPVRDTVFFNKAPDGHYFIPQSSSVDSLCSQEVVSGKQTLYERLSLLDYQEAREAIESQSDSLSHDAKEALLNALQQMEKSSVFLDPQALKELHPPDKLFEEIEAHACLARLLLTSHTLISISEEGDKNSKEKLQKTLDIYLLTKCDKIFHDYVGSFPRSAQEKTEIVRWGVLQAFSSNCIPASIRRAMLEDRSPDGKGSPAITICSPTVSPAESFIFDSPMSQSQQKKYDFDLTEMGEFYVQ